MTAPRSSDRDDPVAASAAAYWSARARGEREEAVLWMDAPGVRAAINRRATGDPEQPVAIALAETFRSRWPLELGLSIGCGTGELERAAVGELGIVRRFDAVDVAPDAIGVARDRAAAAGLGEAIRYEAGDALESLRRAVAAGRRYDLVVFHFVLHHLVALEEILDLARAALRRDPPGIVYVDEYVGPSRDEWSEQELAPARALFERVPAADRRTPEVYPPLAIEDESEMVGSSAIDRLLRERFQVVEYRPYLGNVVHPLVCALTPAAIRAGRVDGLLAEALALEEELAANGRIRSHFAAYLLRR